MKPAGLMHAIAFAGNRRLRNSVYKGGPSIIVSNPGQIKC